jgi:hypothetical protein
MRVDGVEFTIRSEARRSSGCRKALQRHTAQSQHLISNSKLGQPLKCARLWAEICRIVGCHIALGTRQTPPNALCHRNIMALSGEV